MWGKINTLGAGRIKNATKKNLKCVDLGGIPKNCFVNVLQGEPMKISELDKVLNTSYGIVNSLKWIDNERFVYIYNTGQSSYYVKIGHIANGKIETGNSLMLYYASTEIYATTGVFPDPYDDTNIFVAIGASEAYGIGLFMLSADWQTLTLASREHTNSFDACDLRIGTEMYGNGYGGISGGFDSENVMWLSSCEGFFVVRVDRSSRTLSLLGEQRYAMNNGGGSHAVRISAGLCLAIETNGSGDYYYAQMVRFTPAGAITLGTSYRINEGNAGYRNCYPNTLLCTDLGTVLWLGEKHFYKISYDSSNLTITGLTSLYDIAVGTSQRGGFGRLATGEYYLAWRAPGAEVIQLWIFTETSLGNFEIMVIYLDCADFIGRDANLELNENGYGIMYPSVYNDGNAAGNRDAMIYGLFTTFDGVINAVTNNYWFGISRSSAEYGEDIEVEVLA